MGDFHLSKWYLDCVADDGTAIIGYWARLRWRSLALDYAAALFAPASGEPLQVQALRSPPAPVLAGDTCTWRCDPLQLEGEWTAEAAPVRQNLLQTPSGGIRWSIHQPRARARVRFGSTEISGLGYTEELELTIPPWRLPFDTLYWGRFLSPEHALVWLQWELSDSPDQSRRRFAVLDGALDEAPEITEDRLRLPDAAADVDLRAPRRLREGHIAATVLDVIPGLVHLLPRKFRRAHESKRLSLARLQSPGKAPSEGWSIYEVVKW